MKPLRYLSDRLGFRLDFRKLVPEDEVPGPGYVELCLRWIDANVTSPFFIQIGAFDGVTNDPISEFMHAAGWSGLLVEPQPEPFEKLKANYADCENLCFENAAISDVDGQADMFTLPGGTKFAGLSMNSLRKWKRTQHMIVQTVPVMTFRSLLEKHGVQHVDLLVIDTEGHDFEIIRTIDFESVRPAMIHYENNHLSRADRAACVALLRDHGYRFFHHKRETVALRT